MTYYVDQYRYGWQHVTEAVYRSAMMLAIAGHPEWAWAQFLAVEG